MKPRSVRVLQNRSGAREKMGFTEGVAGEPAIYIHESASAFCINILFPSSSINECGGGGD